MRDIPRLLLLDQDPAWPEPPEEDFDDIRADRAEREIILACLLAIAFWLALGALGLWLWLS